MISKNAVYHKSTKGTEAIATRQHGLAPKLRSILILVDGKRRFEELARLSATLGDTEQLLDQLLMDGFIEETAPAVQATQTAAAMLPTSTLPASAQLSLPQAKQFAVRQLTDILGPTAEELCLDIESTRNVHDYDIAVARAERAARKPRGTSAMAEFRASKRRVEGVSEVPSSPASTMRGSMRG